MYIDSTSSVLPSTVSSNLLLNVGPTADGRLDPLFEERLLDIGAWMDVSCGIVRVLLKGGTLLPT